MNNDTRANARVSRFLPLLSGTLLIGIAGALLLCITPRTALTWPLEAVLQAIIASLSARNPTALLGLDSLAYSIGYVLLIACLSAYILARLKGRFSLPVGRFTDVCATSAGLLLFDPFVSVAAYLSPFNRWWAFYVASTFFIVLLCADEKRGLRLIQIVLFAIGIQALYAIVFYFLGFHQLHGKHFGNRAGGTFYGPNELYPLLLLSLPLSLTLSQAPSSIEWRWVLRVIAGLSAIALLLTFTRGAWLAFVALLLYFALARQSPFSARTIWRSSAVVGVVFLIFGVLFVRTRGQMMGAYRDASFWGRIYIWKVAARAVVDRPFLGSGVNTYAQQQNRFMSARLERFHPANVEAKSLYLNVAVEAGLLGLGLMFWGGWRFAALHRLKKRATIGEDWKAAYQVGLFVGVLAIGVAGCVDTPILNSDRLAPTFALSVLLAIGCALVGTPLGIRPEFLRTSPAKKKTDVANVTPVQALNILAAALDDLDRLLNEHNVTYWAIGSCARMAYMDRLPSRVSDIDVLIPNRKQRESLADQIQTIGDHHGLWIDFTLSCTLEERNGNYALVHGPLSYSLPPIIMEPRRVQWGGTTFCSLPPQTLLHTFGIVGQPLRAQDRINVREFAHFLHDANLREFENHLFCVFRSFRKMHWKYFPLKRVQYGWRRCVKAMPRGVRRFLLGTIYPLWPVRQLRYALNHLELHLCLAPRAAPERGDSSSHYKSSPPWTNVPKR